MAPRRTARRRPDQIPGGHHGLAPEEVAESQRRRILVAMIDAVGREGYQAARVADVIAHAGVSRKTFYEHFEDKEHCFIAAYRQSLTRLLAVTLDAFNAQDEWVDSLRAGLTALLDALAHEPRVARLCVVEVLGAGPKAVEARNEAMLRFAYMFDTGRDEADVDLPGFTGLCMVGGLAEILFRQITAGAAAQLPALVPELMYVSVLPFLGPEAAARELERGRNRREGGDGVGPAPVARG